jgi:ferrous iron transport protein B
MLIPLNLSPGQLVVAVTTLAMYFPCVGVFAVLYRELGIFGLSKAVFVMAVSAFLVGGAVRAVLSVL